MIVYLPVNVYDKCVNVPFNIQINNDTLVVNPVSNDKIHNIVLCSSLYGINTISLSFPLTFILIKNELICDMFYIFQTLSSNNEIDFLTLLINALNEQKKINHYKIYNNMNLSNLINVLKLNNNNDNNTDDNINIIINKTFYRINKYLNFCLAIMAEDIVNNVAQSSKILQIINSIKQLKFNFYGNTFTIEEHIEHILNPKLIKKNRYYFYENNNKIIKLHYNLIDSNINKKYIFAYPEKYKENINIKNLLNLLIVNHYDKLFEIACRILYKKKPQIINLICNYMKYPNENYINGFIDCDLIKTDDKINFISNDISFSKFKEIISLFDMNIIISKLLENYSFPINYDKRTLNEYFAKILYYFLNNSEIIHTINVNPKIKSIIIFIIKLYKSLEQGDMSCLYYSRIYTDNLLYQIIKILFFNDTFNLLININNIQQIRHKFINNIIIISILNNLSWKTISTQLSTFKYLVNSLDTCKDLIIVDGKLNKHFTQYMDNRLKKIIIEPLIMFNYLKKEEDFYKWIINFNDSISKIFNNMITLEKSDYKKLSKILYIYSKIKNQNVNDENYKKLLGYLKVNNRLVLFNDRINIKFKDIFKNININLGYMARDIVNEETISVTISDDTIVDSYDITINRLKRKYYKYKGKYLEMKCTETINE